MLGASRGMGRALARHLAGAGHALFLLGRDPEALDKSAADLRLRGAPLVGHAPCELGETAGFDAALDAADAALDGFDTVVLSAAGFGTQEELEADPARAERVLFLNFTASVMFCEAARKRLLARGGGTLCVFSSVAGDRGRKPVVLYGASKAGLSAYLEGLDHRYRAAGLVTVCVKPGFVRTGMTEGLKPPPFAGAPEQVAAIVARALAKGTPVVYAPRIWGLIMAVIRRLPRWVMRRVRF